MTTFAFDINDSSIHFLADDAAQEAFDQNHDGYIIAQWEDLFEMTGFHLVTLYNALQHAIARLTPASGPVTEVKRFATKGAAEDRIKPLVSQLHELTRETEKAAPAKKASTPRRGTGVNLAPKDIIYPCRAGTKQSILVDMLSREQGATMKELLTALSGGKKPWLEVTVKSGLNWDMNMIKGYGIKTSQRGGVDCYQLTYPEGMDAPLPHTVRKG